MQAELARLDPKALESLPKELKDQLPKGLPAGGAGRPMPSAARPAGAAGRRPCRSFRGLPGLPGKKK